METDLLIIGGGPAGLNAAYTAALAGVKTIVVDESFSLGGQLNQQTQMLENLPTSYEKQSGTSLAITLIERLIPFNVTFLLKHTMIGVYSDGRVGVSNGEKTFPITAKKTIITTGAAEEASVFPGWTLPGVMNVGAAQILMNREQVLPGSKAFILGSNTFSLEVAIQLSAAGVNIMGIIESDSQLESNSKESINQVKDARIPIYLNSSISNATGKGEVEKVTLNNDGVEDEYDIDLVCIGKGVTPILEPFEIMNCKLTYLKNLGGWVPKYSKSMETTISSTYVAGNAAGITCMGGILLTGEVAAVSVLESLDFISKEQAVERKEDLWKELYRIETAVSNEVSDARLAIINDSQEVNSQIAPLYETNLGGA